ncbi:MAG: hypothetical protein Q9195_009545, partial [Heterodermia aff. obscurata]
MMSGYSKDSVVVILDDEEASPKNHKNAINLTQARASQIADVGPRSKSPLLEPASEDQSAKPIVKVSAFPKNNSRVLDAGSTLRTAAKIPKTTPQITDQGRSDSAFYNTALQIEKSPSSIHLSSRESPILEHPMTSETCTGPLVSQSIDPTRSKSLDQTRLVRYNKSSKSNISCGRSQVHESCEMRPQKPSVSELNIPRDFQVAASNLVLPFNGADIPDRRTGNLELGKHHEDTVDDFDEISTNDFLTEENAQIWITQQHEAEMERTPSRSSNSKTKKSSQGPNEVRNLPVALPYESLSEFIHNGIRLNPKANAELKNGDFMRIVDVIRDTTTGDIFLRGWIFRRTRHMNGILEKKYNELCWILHVDEDDARDASVQGMESVPVTDVVRRRKIRLTNQAFPAFSFREDGMQDSEQTVLNERVLVCRYKYICTYLNSTMRDRYTWSEKALHRLRAEECDSSLAKDDEELRYDWRGPTDKGGACSGMSTEEKQFLQHEYQAQEALCMANKDVDQSSETESLASSVTSQRDSQTLDYCPDSDMLNEPDPTAAATTSFIDLTEDAQDSASNAWSAMPSVVGASRLTSIRQSARENAPEVVKIDAIIKTTTKSGTLRKRYEGQVTTTFKSHSFLQRKRSCLSEDRESTADFRKRQKTLSKHEERGWPRSSASFPEPSRDLGCDEGLETCSDDSSEDMAILGNHSPMAPDVAISSIPMIQGTTDTGLSPLKALPRTAPAQSASNILTPPSESGAPTDLTIPPSPTRRYTFGDCFCGAGGVSRGAVQAGLRVEWGFDCNAYACSSYRLNNPFTAVYPLWAHDFCHKTTDRDFKVDICHLSPPCQFFSDAHTVMGKHDDVNTASLFAISELVKKAKPRVVMLEQTSGLLRRHEIYFNAVVLMFTALGFSIRWKILNCADYGVPQRRMRIFMIVS